MSILLNNHILKSIKTQTLLLLRVAPIQIQQIQSQRQYWKEVLRIKSFNPKAKKNKVVLEDVETMSLRSNISQAHEGKE